MPTERLDAPDYRTAAFRADASGLRQVMAQYPGVEAWWVRHIEWPGLWMDEGGEA